MASRGFHDAAWGGVQQAARSARNLTACRYRVPTGRDQDALPHRFWTLRLLAAAKTANTAVRRIPHAFRARRSDQQTSKPTRARPGAFVHGVEDRPARDLHLVSSRPTHAAKAISRQAVVFTTRVPRCKARHKRVKRLMRHVRTSPFHSRLRRDSQSPSQLRPDHQPGALILLHMRGPSHNELLASLILIPDSVCCPFLTTQEPRALHGSPPT